MMPMRIRRKTRPIEKLENSTALQCGGRSFPCDHPTQFTLASTRKCVLDAIVCEHGGRVLGTEASASSWPGLSRPSTRCTRHEERGCPGLRLAEAASAAQARQARA